MPSIPITYVSPPSEPSKAGTPCYLVTEETKSQMGLSNRPRSHMKLRPESSLMTPRADSTDSTHLLPDPKAIQVLDNPPEKFLSSARTSNAYVSPELCICASLKSTVGLKVDLFSLFPLATRKPRVNSVAHLNMAFMLYVNHILLLVQYHFFVLRLFSASYVLLICSMTAHSIIPSFMKPS